uniref:Uncharacterized protein n=1 Tax=Strongyloides papillosus TaxID=174720 RepID=A0A0N5BYD4_STREA
MSIRAYSEEDQSWCSKHCYAPTRTTSRPPPPSWGPNDYLVAFILFLWMVKF